MPEGRGYKDLHWHEELQFTYVVNGELRIRIDGKDYLVKEKEAVFINRNLLHITTDLTEDGKYIAVRFHDFTGGTNKLTVTPGFAWKRYCECDLRERPQGDFKENGMIQRTVKPYEIVTLLFEV